MSFYELFKKGHQSRNLAHFASIASLAKADGKITDEETELLKSLAIKLSIGASEVIDVLKNPAKYPIVPSNSAEERLERIYDLFDMIFADHEISVKELVLIKRYAIGLGYNITEANDLIHNSIEIYTGKIKFSEYKHMIEKRMKG
ncbi:MAG: hypothetical protein COB12_03555 [Flavobacterium sp.]|nr:MAG: hypothetical protein COB12_03555 [Flavobacterium sp.]